MSTGPPPCVVDKKKPYTHTPKGQRPDQGVERLVSMVSIEPSTLHKLNWGLYRMKKKKRCKLWEKTSAKSRDSSLQVVEVLENGQKRRSRLV